MRPARKRASAIMLGDTPYDVEAAMRAGIDDRRRSSAAGGRVKSSRAQPCGLSGPDRPARPLRRVAVRYFAYFLNTVSRFAGFDVRRAAHRSPTFANRAGAVRIVKSRGSTPSNTSFHFSGVETPAYSLARALYAVASVLPRMFCR